MQHFYTNSLNIETISPQSSITPVARSLETYFYRRLFAFFHSRRERRAFGWGWTCVRAPYNNSACFDRARFNDNNNTGSSVVMGVFAAAPYRLGKFLEIAVEVHQHTLALYISQGRDLSLVWTSPDIIYFPV